MSEVDFNPFAGGELLRVAPTTAPQKEIFAAAKMSDEANTAFNEAIVLDVKGELDVKLLEKCFNSVIERHDILRATFSPTGEDICLQDSKSFDLEYEDMRGLSRADQLQAVQSLLKNIAISPMNLEEGPLLFAWLKQLDDSEYKLIVATHHLVCDGWSFGILLSELMGIYSGNGSDENLQSPASFFDFADQQAAAEIINADTDFWLERFQQVPPNLDLPLDFTRPLVRSFRAARYDYHLNHDLVTGLPKAAARLKSSLVNFVMAGYFALLYRLSGNNDIVVGLPVAGQAVLNKPNLFGHMVQLLPIRLQLDGDESFAEVVAMVKREVLSATEHPNFTFGKLLETIPVDRLRVPLINTIFNIDQPMAGLKFGAADVNIKSVPRSAESFEIFLNIVPSQNDLLIEATYSSALFSEETIQSWLQTLETILRLAVENSDATLDKMPLLQALPDIQSKVNATEKETKFCDFVSAFDACVARAPDNTAVIAGDKSLTYSGLAQKASALANNLLKQGVKEGSVVGICCERTENLLISSIAILKAGAAYLPLDPDFPQERLAYMLEDSGAVAVIEDKSAPVGVREAPVIHIDLDATASGELNAASLPVLSPSRDRMAYTIYTSGSTGKPKGVRVQNGAMINFLESMAAQPGFTEQDRLLAVTTLSFDISVLELFLPLIVGGVTVIAARDEAKSGEQLAALINKHNISVMQATPSTWRMLLSSDGQSVNAAHKIKALCGGEPLPVDLAGQLLPLVSELWNMYGPTETTVWSTCKKITRRDQLITVGTPIANTRIYVLDTNLNPLPVSVPGELCIGGEGVTLGYHNRPELNQDRFVEHPKFGRIYRTGDVAKLLPTGEVQHLGRMDDQVKLRGYRIELGEIETALSNCKGVLQAVVYLWKLSEQDIRLVACCVPQTGTAIDTISIRKELRSTLPGYMIPQYFLDIDALPLMPNGKIDRRNLPRPQINESSILGGGGLNTDIERTIAGIWSELLKITGAVGREDNFFELGGHSLLAIEAIRRIENATGARLELTELVTDRLATLAEKVVMADAADSIQSQGPKALPATAIRRLSAEQRRLLRQQLSVPESTVNNLPAAWVLDGELNLDLFKSSILRVFERQTALRTVVARDHSVAAENNGYHLVLRHVSDISLPDYFDYSDKDAPLDAAVADVFSKTRQPFAMLDQLLCRALLYRLGDARYLLAIIPHHLIFDGWSFDIFLSELSAYYAAAIDGHAATLAPLVLQYRDYSQWLAMRSPDSKTLNFHKRTLNASIDVKLPFNPEAAKGVCRRLCIALNIAELEKLESFCDKSGLRIHELLLAALCHTYSDWANTDVCHIGMPVTGRYIPEVIGLIGSFVSTLPAEFKVYKGSFIRVARDIADQLKEFYRYQDLSFAELTEGTEIEDQQFAINIPVSFAFQDVRKRPAQLANLNISQIDIDRQQTVYPIEFWVRIQSDGLLLMFDYDDGQVDINSLKQLIDKIASLLKSLDTLDEKNPVSEKSTALPNNKKTLWRRLFQ